MYKWCNSTAQFGQEKEMGFENQDQVCKKVKKWRENNLVHVEMY